MRFWLSDLDRTVHIESGERKKRKKGAEDLDSFGPYRYLTERGRERATQTMSPLPTQTILSSLPFSRYPFSLSSPFLPLRLPLSLSSSALPLRSRSHLNLRRQFDGSDEATWNLEDEIDDDEEASEERKPRGFGAKGIQYDTSLEEMMLKEMQRSRKDQTVNKVKVKKEFPKSKGLKKPQDKDSATLPTLRTTTGIRVRLWSLPKKKNIQRDLQTAFKGFRGILDISPAISGNKKTRDPVCKGFAFVEVATEEAATRFVETFSKRNISFGKVEKRISCCVVNPNSNSTTRKSPNYQKSQILQPQLHEGFMGISDNSSDETPIIFVEGDDEEEEDSLSSFQMMKFDDGEGEDDKLDVKITRLPPRGRKKTAGSKSRVRPRKAKSSQLSLPLRLKGKERNVLTGVFFKYGVNSGTAPTTEN